MQFTLDPSGTPQQQAWVNRAIAACNYPVDALAVGVTVVWASASPCSLHHPYMCTEANDDGSFTITIEPWADDPSNPNLRGLPSPAADIQEFYMESFVHELGHVIHYTLITNDDARTAAASLFWTPEANSAAGRRWGTLADYAPVETSTLTWAAAIVEAIAECIKCAFYVGELIYMNRTEWHIDPQEWQAFINLILPAGEGFDEKWAADENNQPLDVGDFATFTAQAGVVVPETTSGAAVACAYQHTNWSIG